MSTTPERKSDLGRAPAMTAEGEAAMLRAMPRLKELLAGSDAGPPGPAL